MPYVLYVGLQDDDKIAIFAIDAGSGQLRRRADVPAAGGPSVMAISLDRHTLYVGQRTQPALSATDQPGHRQFNAAGDGLPATLLHGSAGLSVLGWVA